MEKRTGPHKKAMQIIKYFRHEAPDYNYIRAVFQHLRKELNVSVTTESKKLPYVPTEAEMLSGWMVWGVCNSKKLRSKLLLWQMIRWVL